MVLVSPPSKPSILGRGGRGRGAKGSIWKERGPGAVEGGRSAAIAASRIALAGRGASEVVWAGTWLIGGAAAGLIGVWDGGANSSVWTVADTGGAALEAVNCRAMEMDVRNEHLKL